MTNITPLPNQAAAEQRRKAQHDAELLNRFRWACEAWRDETNPIRKRTAYEAFRVLAGECEKRRLDMRD